MCRIGKSPRCEFLVQRTAACRRCDIRRRREYDCLPLLLFHEQRCALGLLGNSSARSRTPRAWFPSARFAGVCRPRRSPVGTRLCDFNRRHGTRARKHAADTVAGAIAWDGAEPHAAACARTGPAVIPVAGGLTWITGLRSESGEDAYLRLIAPGSIPASSPENEVP